MSNTVEIGGKRVNLRLTKKNLKNAKIRHEVDLSTFDMTAPMNSPVFRLANDPVMLIEHCWYFHEDQLVALGFDEDSFCDAIDETAIKQLREHFLASCAAFFPLIETLPTLMRELLPGSQTLQQTIAEVAKKNAATTP